MNLNHSNNLVPACMMRADDNHGILVCSYTAIDTKSYESYYSLTKIDKRSVENEEY